MTGPTARVLTLLEVLQSGGTHRVADLAARLDVDERTLRRYIDHLKNLDIPVRSMRGPHGGYRLAAGFRMPPLMLSDEEALAVMLGLTAGRRAGVVATSDTAAESAIAKLRRVLPVGLAERLEALRETLEFTTPDRPAVPAEGRVLLLLAEASRDRRPVAITYRDRTGGTTERTLSPYGLVSHSGRWYVTGADSLSGEIRTFRVDRIADPALRQGSFDVSEQFDAGAHVLAQLARTPWRHEVSVRVQGTAEHVGDRVPAGLATLTPLAAELTGATSWVRLRLRAERLDWVPLLLASLDRPFVIEEPEELRGLVEDLAQRLQSYAGTRPDDDQPSGR